MIYELLNMQKQVGNDLFLYIFDMYLDYNYIYGTCTINIFLFFFWFFFNFSIIFICEHSTIPEIKISANDHFIEFLHKYM